VLFLQIRELDGGDEFALDAPSCWESDRFDLDRRVGAPETGGLTTSPTAIEVARAEIARHDSTPLPEKRAIPRGSGGWGLVNPNRRRRVWASMGAAAHVYLCWKCRRFGFGAHGPPRPTAASLRRFSSISAIPSSFTFLSGQSGMFLSSSR
jgi:hypothetical protein